MPNNDILKFLIEGKKRGFEIDYLRNKLIEKGFLNKEIDEAITHLNNSNKKPFFQNKKFWLFLVIILLILVVILILALKMMKRSHVEIISVDIEPPKNFSSESDLMVTDNIIIYMNNSSQPGNFGEINNSIT
ncbi:MAG: hypothetical protein ACOYT4_01970 [Nanoarchaeota archaeon]